MSAVKAGTGRPTKGYFLANGERVPSVTTITSRFKDSGGLLHWAWKEGRDGRQLYEARDKAAEAGAICHGWIEDYIQDRPVLLGSETPEHKQATVGYLAFKEWAGQVHLEILETEVPLVSEEYAFGGTFDALAKIAGKLTLLDWKTSSGTYPEYVVQLAAYRQLIRERDGGKKVVHARDYGHETRPAPLPTGAQLLRVGKEYADFHVHSWPEVVLDIGWKWFVNARAMYDLDKELKKVTR